MKYSNIGYGDINRVLKQKVQGLLGVIPMEARQGFKYYRLKNFLSSAQYWPKDQIKDWQLQQLKSLIYSAYENTDGYRQLYDEARIHPNDLEKISDLKYFPKVSKFIMRDNIKDFTSREWNKEDLYLMSTSGSSGHPFSFYNVRKDPFEQAFMFLQWEWFGQNPNEIAAVLKGAFNDSHGQLYKLDRYKASLFLSTSQLSEKTLPLYLDLIRRHKVRILRALPSSLYILCLLLQKINHSEWPHFDIISISSENIYDWQYKLFKSVFPNAVIFTWYGHSEKTLLAPICEKTQNYHVWPFYGISEVLNKDGDEVTEGNIGQIIGTSFCNKATYFIRYETGDMAEKGAEYCSECGRNFQLLNKIHGRDQELIIAKDGRKISATVLNLQDTTYDNLNEFQLYQDTKGIVVFKYIPKTLLSMREQNALSARLKEKLGDKVTVQLEKVDSINRNNSGKYVFMDQRLSL
jgi:phenylacetate-CoA ligase